MSSLTKYWCSIGWQGSQIPAIAPTSRAQSPAALTTCSATRVPCSVTTSQCPSAFGLSSSTRLRRVISAPFIRAALA